MNIMKTKLLGLSLIILFAITSVSAQEKGEVRAGLGLIGGTKAGIENDGSTKLGLGLSTSVEYMVTDAISGSVSYDYYFPSTVGGIDFKISYFNIDGRYYFIKGNTQVYGLVGVGIGAASPGTGETGLNVGAGAVFPISDALGINAQLKYQTPGDGQLAMQAGLVYTFGK